jgi:AraC-like DNA-binding protein/mannose-6-phosphate isomerase-like protein (cupin superfamily)
MDAKLLEYLSRISDEEKRILTGSGDVEESIYSTTKKFVVDSNKMLQRRKLIDIRPHTRFVNFPSHRHNYIEIVYMCSGTMTHIINGTAEVVLETGDLLFLNRNAEHEILKCGEEDIAVNFIVLPEFFNQAFTMVEGSNMIFDFIFAREGGSFNEGSYIHFQAHDILPVQNIAETMIWSIVNKQNYERSINQSTMGLLILYLLNHTDRINENDPNQYEKNIVIKLLKYIDENYKNASLKEFAAAENLPLYYLSKLVPKQTGNSYKELLQQRRLNRAVQLLTQTGTPIEEIASEIGYENNSYFHKLFREKYETTPHEFRKQRFEEDGFLTREQEPATRLPEKWW